MRKLILAAALGAVGLSAAPAMAQPYGHYMRDYRHDIRDSRQDCRRAMRHADNRWEYRRAQNYCRHEMREARRDGWRDRDDWRHRDWRYR